MNGEGENVILNINFNNLIKYNLSMNVSWRKLIDLRKNDSFFRSKRPAYIW